jgi:hypothetical protein
VAGVWSCGCLAPNASSKDHATRRSVNTPDTVLSAGIQGEAFVAERLQEALDAALENAAGFFQCARNT